MNSAYIWILFPLMMAAVLLLLMRWRTLVAIIGTAISITLAGLAAWLPAQDQLVIWRWVLPFSDTFVIFGRRLVLAGDDRPALIILFLAAALWFGAAPLARPTRLFVPFGLAMVALFTAAIAVEPFLFAAVLIEIAVLLSIPFLSPPGSSVSHGVLRYLTFQSLGMPFLLIAGFLFTGIEVNPGDQEFVTIAIALLAIGFALMLAVFPFHTWVPMLAEETHPYPTFFVLLLLPIVISILGLGFIDNFIWIKDNPNTGILVQVIGVIMVITAGVWAAVEKNLSRMIGFAVILDIGFSLLAISLTTGEDSTIYRMLFYAGLLPRSLSLVVLALALSILINRLPDFDIGELRSLFKKNPVISISIVVSLLSIAGMPLLASFPQKLGLIEGLSSQATAISTWVIAGSLGLIIGAVRLLRSMVSDGDDPEESIPGSRLANVYLWIGIGLLFLVGLLPNIFLQLVTRFPGAFGAQG
ncbi:MAG: proton-conducting transporter membrane subunit [Anaerolineales bacterium]